MARFRLTGEIARGGMGVVYRADDPDLGREVAVKVLAAHLASRPEAARRFRDEARITGQLQHPGIPPVFAVGDVADGRPFLAMKLIKGRTLDDLLKDRPDPAADRGKYLAVFEQVCQAVAYAHAHGVVHRDLKPQNVMVGAFGEVQVMDWGLAKVLGGGEPDRPAAAAAPATEIRTLRDADGSFTQAGSIMGTPAFMPPEQAGGETDKVDCRSDVFGLGAVLCVILTGDPPYRAADTDAVRLMAIRGQLADASARLDACGADPELLALCRRCLAADRDGRPADAGAVAAAVAAFRAGAEARARQAEVDRVRAEGERRAAEVRAAEERKRRRVQLLFAGSVAAAVALAGAGAWHLQRQADEREREREAARLEKAGRDERARLIADQTFARLPELYRRGLWKQADAALQQAADALGPDGDPDLRARVERAKADTALVRRLDEIRLEKAGTPGKPAIDIRGAVPKYAAVFRENGYDPEAGDAADLAQRLNASPVRDYLLAGLDDWALSKAPEATVRRLFALTAAATGQEWRARLPDVLDDTPKLLALFDAIPPDQRTPGLVAGVLTRAGPAGVRRLEQSLIRNPGDFWLNFLLGQLEQDDRPDRAVGAYRAALAVRPDAVPVYVRLSSVYALRGDLRAAADTYREAVRLAPDDVLLLMFYADMLESLGDLPAAADANRALLRMVPDNATVHHSLGDVLKGQGKVAEAAAAYRAAIRLEPGEAQHYVALVELYQEAKDLPAAAAAYRETLQKFPKYGILGVNLARALVERGDLPAAADVLLEGVRADPATAQFLIFVDSPLQHAGRYPELVELYRRALELKPKDAKLQASLRDAEKKAALYQRLSAVKAGAKPATPLEAAALAGFAGSWYRKEYALAYRLYREAFAADPALAGKHQYSAACAALRFAAGDDPTTKPAPGDRAALRKQALDWLSARLAKIRGMADQKEAARLLAFWQKDADLLSVRDPVRRAWLPGDEPATWDKFWAEVEQARKQAAGK